MCIQLDKSVESLALACRTESPALVTSMLSHMPEGWQTATQGAEDLTVLEDALRYCDNPTVWTYLVRAGAAVRECSEAFLRENAAIEGGEFLEAVAEHMSLPWSTPLDRTGCNVLHAALESFAGDVDSDVIRFRRLLALGGDKMLEGASDHEYQTPPPPVQLLQTHFRCRLGESRVAADQIMQLFLERLPEGGLHVLCDCVYPTSSLAQGLSTLADLTATRVARIEHGRPPTIAVPKCERLYLYHVDVRFPWSTLLNIASIFESVAQDNPKTVSLLHALPWELEHLNTFSKSQLTCAVTQVCYRRAVEAGAREVRNTLGIMMRVRGWDLA